MVKRLVSIEDLGNIEVLFTDKTGTLTEGADHLRGGPRRRRAAVRRGPARRAAVQRRDPRRRARGRRQPARPGALAGAAAPRGRARTSRRRLAARPFDYQRRLASVLVEDPTGGGEIDRQGRAGDRCSRAARVPPARRRCSTRSSRPAAASSPSPPARPTARTTPHRRRRARPRARRLPHLRRPAEGRRCTTRSRACARLGVEVKVITGDNDRVAQKVCADLGLAVDGTLTGAQLDALDDDALAAALPRRRSSRASPPSRSRASSRRSARSARRSASWATASTTRSPCTTPTSASPSQTATDVAKDAADIVLLDKDLDILAGGVVEGRRIFANTIKYVLMGTSSNFGNMFSAGGASLFLSFLPMLPTQILLNNLLYDASEMTIPTDNVDEEQLRRPRTGTPRSSAASCSSSGRSARSSTSPRSRSCSAASTPARTLFRSGWFVESLATQSLVIFAIRTRRVPFFRSRPSLAARRRDGDLRRDRRRAALLPARRRARLHRVARRLPRRPRRR